MWSKGRDFGGMPWFGNSVSLIMEQVTRSLRTRKSAFAFSLGGQSTSLSWGSSLDLLVFCLSL